MSKKIQTKLNQFRLSKKLTLAVSALVFIVMTDVLGLDVSQETVMSVTGIAVTYLLGQSAIDIKKK